MVMKEPPPGSEMTFQPVGIAVQQDKVAGLRCHLDIDQDLATGAELFSPGSRRRGHGAGGDDPIEWGVLR